MFRTVKGAFVAQTIVAAALECHPQGPIFPRSSSLTQSRVFQDALSNLTQIFDSATKGDIKTGWDTRNVSMSIGIVTLDQAEPSLPAWEYHHLASGNTNGTQHVDRDSQYLIGSVSKAISVAVTLRSGVDLDKPVTQYLPSLADPESLISWENITLRALASQLSGIPPNCMSFVLLSREF
jgi:CubicO group peptidase (beta-lactamase class C family)